jgi:hypothetical protein
MGEIQTGKFQAVGIGIRVKRLKRNEPADDEASLLAVCDCGCQDFSYSWTGRV